MNEESDNQVAADEGPVGGGRLRAARRANDISVGDVAKELHLDEPKVRAMEKNDFDALGAPVFAKGHLRKYAELVGVSVDDIMTDYYKMTRAAGVQPVLAPVRKVRREINAGPWIAGFVIVLLVAGVAAAAYWWFAQRQAEPPVALPAPATSAIIEATPDQADEQPAESRADPAEADTGSPDAAAVELPESTVEPAAAGPEPLPQETASEALDSDEPRVTIGLSFTGDCWTEASDATGRRLYYNLGSAGESVTLSGVAPVRIILGDADNVSMTVDGREYTIPPAARSGRLARLTIDSL